MSDVETRIAVLEVHREHLVDRIDEVGAKVAKIESKMESGFASLNEKLDALAKRPVQASPAASVAKVLVDHWKPVLVWLLVIFGGQPVATKLLDSARGLFQ